MKCRDAQAALETAAAAEGSALPEAVAAHLAGCARCSADWAAVQHAGRLLAFARLDPPGEADFAALQSRILAATAGARPRVFWQPWTALRWAGAGVALLLLAVVSLQLGPPRPAAPRAETSVAVAEALPPSATAARGHGRVQSPDRDVRPDGLPPQAASAAGPAPAMSRQVIPERLAGPPVPTSDLPAVPTIGQSKAAAGSGPEFQATRARRSTRPAVARARRPGAAGREPVRTPARQRPAPSGGAGAARVASAAARQRPGTPTLVASMAPGPDAALATPTAVPKATVAASVPNNHPVSMALAGGAAAETDIRTLPRVVLPMASPPPLVMSSEQVEVGAAPADTRLMMQPAVTIARQSGAGSPVSVAEEPQK